MNSQSDFRKKIRNIRCRRVWNFQKPVTAHGHGTQRNLQIELRLRQLEREIINQSILQVSLAMMRRVDLALVLEVF